MCTRGGRVREAGWGLPGEAVFAEVPGGGGDDEEGEGGANEGGGEGFEAGGAAEAAELAPGDGQENAEAAVGAAGGEVAAEALAEGVGIGLLLASEFPGGVEALLYPLSGLFVEDEVAEGAEENAFFVSDPGAQGGFGFVFVPDAGGADETLGVFVGVKGVGGEHGFDEAVFDEEGLGEVDAAQGGGAGGVELSAEFGGAGGGEGGGGLGEPGAGAGGAGGDFEGFVDGGDGLGVGGEGFEEEAEGVGTGEEDVGVEEEEDVGVGGAEVVDEVVPGVGFAGGVEFVDAGGDGEGVEGVTGDVGGAVGGAVDDEEEASVVFGTGP